MPASRPARNRSTARQPQRRGQAGPPRSGRGPAAGAARRPLPKGDTLYTKNASRTRQAIERRSAVLLVYLHQLPRWVVPLLIAALFLAGVLIPGVPGAALLVLLAAFLGWLSYLSWQAITRNARLVRTITVCAVLALAVRSLLAK